MAIQMLRENAAIPALERTVALGEEQRQRRQAEAQAEYKLQQEIGADRAMREGIGQFYANRPAVSGPVVTAPNTPSAPQVTVPAPQVAPQAPAPVVSPDVVSGPGTNPDYGDLPSSAAPRPNAVPREVDMLNTPVTAAPAAAASVPATPPSVPNTSATTPAVPAAAPGMPPTTASAMPARGGPADISPIMSRLAQTPGTGHAALQMFTADQHNQAQARTLQAQSDRQARLEGDKLWIQALKDGDVQMAQTIGQQYGMNIPPEMYKNRGFMLDARLAATLAHSIPGLKDGEGGATFVDEFLKAKMSGADNQTAAQKAAAAARKIEPGMKAVHWAVDENGEVTGFTAAGKPISTGVTARPTASESRSDRPSATIQNRDDAGRRLKIAFPGLDEHMIQRLVMNPRSQVTPQDIVKQANALFTADSKQLGSRKKYKTAQDAMADAQGIISQAQRAAAGMEMGNTGEYMVPPAAAPSTTPAARNRIRFDAQGNQLGQ